MASASNRSRPTGGLVGYGAGAGAEENLPLPPTQARGVEKRDRIYAAALARFAADGVEGTRVEDVIADAGVSWATFFRYFPRKADVLIELAARHFRGPVREAVREGLADGRLDARTAIERTFTALLAPGEASPALHTASLLEVFANPPRFAALVEADDPQPLVALVAGLLAAAQRRGELRASLDPETAALTVVAGALFPAVQAAALGADPRTPLSAALEVLWDGMREPG